MTGIFVREQCLLLHIALICCPSNLPNPCSRFDCSCCYSMFTVLPIAGYHEGLFWYLPIKPCQHLQLWWKYNCQNNKSFFAVGAVYPSSILREHSWSHLVAGEKQTPSFSTLVLFMWTKMALSLLLIVALIEFKFLNTTEAGTWPHALTFSNMNTWNSGMWAV